MIFLIRKNKYTKLNRNIKSIAVSSKNTEGPCKSRTFYCIKIYISLVNALYSFSLIACLIKIHLSKVYYSSDIPA